MYIFGISAMVLVQAKTPVGVWIAIIGGALILVGAAVVTVIIIKKRKKQ